jgi:hypothetical protein
MLMESLQVLSRHVAVALALSFAAGLACAAAPNKVTEEVIVEGTRPEIEKRAYTFVTGVTHDGYRTKSLARWNQPICPLVAGIPVDQGEFILRGVSQAALAAGAPLGPEDCKANFHVVVTSDPDRLMVLWCKRAPRLFGGESPAAVRRVMGTPRPIRIWYNAQQVCGAGWTATADAGGVIGQMFAGGSCRAKDTHLKFTAVRPISSVIVLVDFDDVQTMKLGALTDYISMVGLAEVDLDGNWGDAPTVLRLFSNTADLAAQRLSAWDRGFLKALYHTPQKSRFQRSEISRSMVREFTGE